MGRISVKIGGKLRRFQSSTDSQKGLEGTYVRPHAEPFRTRKGVCCTTQRGKVPEPEACGATNHHCPRFTSGLPSNQGENGNLYVVTIKSQETWQFVNRNK